MGRRMAFALSVVLLGFGGGVLALFVRGMHAERRAVAGSDLFLRRQLEGTVVRNRHEVIEIASRTGNIAFVPRRECRYEFFAHHRKVPSQPSASQRDSEVPRTEGG